MAAIQHLPVTYVFTHDSIAVGEDGAKPEPDRTVGKFVSDAKSSDPTSC